MTTSVSRSPFSRLRSGAKIPRDAGMLVLQLALPHYRSELVQELASDSRILFATGDAQFLPGVTRGVVGSNVINLPSNTFLFGRRLAYQHVDLRAALTASTLVIELNPRIINSWVYLVARRLLGRRTLAWGHVFPRSGPSSRTDRVRGLMRRLLDGMIVYTESEARSFEQLHPGPPTFVATNALYRRSEIGAPGRRDPNGGFVMIGRLVQSKKPALVIEALRIARREEPEISLKIVGAGPEEQGLRAEAADLVNEGVVTFAGEVTQLQELREIFRASTALVCGGYVGLNVTQAIGFGLPVVYALGEPHAPEVEMLGSANSVSAKSASPDDFAYAMLEVWRSRREWAGKAEAIASLARERYSIESMANAFRRAAEGEEA